MFPKKSGHTVLTAKLIRFTPSPCTRQENAALWRKVNELTLEKKEVTADKNIRFNESSPKQRRNRLLE
jgi:hypothetical protein